MLHELRLRLRPLVPPGWQSTATGALMAAARVALRGEGVHCPCCGRSFRRFLAYPDPFCPACGSYGRHRALALLLDLHPGLVVPPPRTLHLAPERCLAGRLAAASADYVSIDLAPGRAEYVMDVASLSFPDASFDLVLCSHVLNEVTDRPRAIRELVRVLRTRGLAILLGVASVEEARAELDRAGFEVAVRGLRTGLDPELADSSGIFPDEPLFFCRKPSG